MHTKSLNKPQNSLDDIFSGSNVPQHRFYPVGMVHEFFIFNELDEPADLVDLLTVLNTSCENDIVNIHLNTPGGNLMSAISLIHAMNRSKAQIVAHADGLVASAGSIIFFSAPTKVVEPYSQLMLHDASMFTGGKLSESIKTITSTTELVRTISHDVYFPYFTEQEIDDILDGKDFYCTSDEICERLKAGEEYIQSMIEAMKDSNTVAEEQQSVKTKKKAKK